MINKGEQGKTPITSANEFLRLLGPTPSESAGSSDYLLRTDMSQLVPRSYSMQNNNDLCNSLVIKVRQQTVPVHIENCDDDVVDRRRIFSPAKANEDEL